MDWVARKRISKEEAEKLVGRYIPKTASWFYTDGRFVQWVQGDEVYEYDTLLKEQRHSRANSPWSEWVAC